ncbi:hypothetical protein [Neolewinella antarctica]|uniref:Uncharacterized protein n=1 Tax=Neolewinella antarctica TaxID=442734 RepID=A0ABX0X7F6_9BACT|nr:hypothetical protein [Neolewinella antarctica]NJC24919.1 hypothetical protein [Neolewinella antarctica]
MTIRPLVAKQPNYPVPHAGSSAAREHRYATHESIRARRDGRS